MHPAGSFTSVSSGGKFACAIRTDATLACWGYPYDGSTTPPAGSFMTVSAGLDHACAIRTDQTLVCWGSGYQPPSTATGPTSPTIPVAPVLAVAPKAKPKPISAASAFTFPSSKACVSRRKFTIRIRKLRGITFVSATVIVNGKHVTTVNRSRITAPVNLTGLPKGRFTVSITAKTSDGRKVTGKRRYHTCAAKRHGTLPKL
jgi:hypothetical protein